MGNQKDFYTFVGLHTFLIGLFPFYLPMFLWKLKYSISEISFFIALTGIGYCLTLWFWDRLHKKISLQKMIQLSFLLELLLLITVFASHQTALLPILAILYGAYNCFFWITNRVLFFEIVTPANSGKNFGNFQIIVTVILKTGVFCGGFLLDRYSYSAIFVLSSLVAILSIGFFSRTQKATPLSPSLLRIKPIRFSSIIKFKDDYKSKLVFSIDGLFLYLESFFWVITLFLIVNESFWQLGMLVILLMAIFGIVFFLIKNRIDRLPGNLVYRISVGLYIISWLLRGVLHEDMDLPLLFLLLVLITFFTSLFRLSFNKRFFDLARTTTQQRYIFFKSYYSQFFIAVLFGLIGLLLLAVDDAKQAIRYTYFTTGFIALGYFCYRSNDQPAG
jgi:MFS family permease